VLVDSGVFVGAGVGVLVGSGVSVGAGVGVLIGSGVSVGTGVEMVGVGLAPHPLTAKMTRPRSASRKHALSGVFCISIASCISEKQASRMPVGRRITDADLNWQDTENGSAASEGGQPVAHDEPDEARQDKVPLAESH